MVQATSIPHCAPSGVVLSGIRTSGRYLFIRVPAPFGYVKATSSTRNSNPLGMVKVSVDQTPFIDVTGADGQYVVIGSAGAGAVGSNQISAAALTTDATGEPLLHSTRKTRSRMPTSRSARRRFRLSQSPRVERAKHDSDDARHHHLQ